MAIEKIQAEDFPNPQPAHALTEESAAVMALQPGEAVKFPCRWKHHSRNDCKGSNSLRAAARRQGFRVSITCQNKMVYVMRREEN